VLQTLLHLLGKPLGQTCEYSSLAEKRSGQDQRFDLAGLRPSRFVVVGEAPRSLALNASLVKGMTGGDSIRAALKHKDAFDFQPKFKLWLQSNFPVNGDADDDAFWSRIKPFEFPYSHAGSEDKSIKSGMLQTETLKGVLVWAVAGAQMWYTLGSKGLETPEEIKGLASRHREMGDHVADWLTECETPSDEEYFGKDGRFTSATEVRASYEKWCKANGITHPKNAKNLAETLRKKGYEPSEVQKINGKSVRGVGRLQLEFD
jgi:putative DNA primase/helicase